MRSKALGLIVLAALAAGLTLAAQEKGNRRGDARNHIDLWSQDTPSDTGLEPDPATVGQPMWQSQDIYVRNTNTAGPHQNPEYGQVNYVHVRVRNRGTITATNVPVEVYYANASVGLSWPADWTLIHVGLVTSLAPGASTEVIMPWNPPGPPPPSHFCLLARVKTPQDPMTFAETANVNLNVRQNNNLVWRNVNIVDLYHSPRVQATFNYRNPDRVKHRSRLLVREQPDGEGFFKRGRVTIDLGPRLARRWQESGRKGKGIKMLNDHTLQFENGGSIDVNLNGREGFDLGLTFEDTTPRPAANPDSHRYGVEIVQEDADKRTQLGGIAYQIMAPVPAAAQQQ